MAGTTFNNIYRNVIRNEIGKIVIWEQMCTLYNKGAGVTCR